MDFATIGKLSTYVKTKNLSFAAKHKIRTGQTLTNASGNLMSVNMSSTFQKLTEASKAATDQAKQQKLALIRQKLKSGQKLSDEELGFLRVNDPKTYKKAKAVDDAREELKSELKKAKTKDEAQEAMTRAMVKASTSAMSELSALGQSGGNVSAGAMTAGGVNDSAGVTQGEQSPVTTDVNQSSQAMDSMPVNDNTDSERDTPEDVMEKYLWTIRALEDEWLHFTNSKDYKDLSERMTDKTSRRLIDAVTAYRRAMTA